MNLLLDTHIAIWAVAERRRLSSAAKDLIEAPGNRCFVSAVAILEIAIKHQRGGIAWVPLDGQEALREFGEAGFTLIDITPEACAHVGTLPDIHRDPFDRLMIAQALLEPFRLLTRDRTVARYSDTVILV